MDTLALTSGSGHLGPQGTYTLQLHDMPGTHEQAQAFRAWACVYLAWRYSSLVNWAASQRRKRRTSERIAA